MYSDPYMVLADFASYAQAQAHSARLYQNRTLWNRMSLKNIAKAGIFAADRSINDYAKNIWNISPIKRK